MGLSAGGTISGSSTAAGLFNFTYSLNDGTNTIHRGANIRVTTVKITSTILANATQNLPYGPVAIEASGGTGAYTFTQDGGILFTSAPIDSTAPLVTATAPGMLWPPSGRTVPVQVRGTIRDAGSGVNLSSARFAVTDEYATVHPSGEVTVSADGNFTVNVPLVAARHEADADGHKYTIVISAKDTAGNEGSTTVIVVVPHDQGK